MKAPNAIFFFNIFSFFIHFCWEWHLALYILSYFHGIRNLSGLNDLYSLNNLGGLNDLFSLISSKKLLNLRFSSTLAPKWPFLVFQCGMNHQKSTILLVSGTLSVGGCGGHVCYFQPNPRVISQISTSHKRTELVFMT